MRDSPKEKPLENGHLTICISKTLLGGHFRFRFPARWLRKNDQQRSKREEKKRKGEKKVEEEEGREFPGAVAFLSLVKF